MSALTLSQYKSFMTDAVSPTVVDEIVGGKSGSNILLERLPFTSNASLNKYGDKLAWQYRYYRRETQRGLAVRTVNNEYTPEQVTAPVPYTVNLSIFGGAFEFDRVMRNAGAIVDFYAEQFLAMQRAVAPKMADLIINGDASVSGEFDGLDIALAGSSTEWNADGHIDISTKANVKTNWEEFQYQFLHWLRTLSRKPDFFLVNGAFHPKFGLMAKYASSYGQTEDSFGRVIETWDGIPFIDLGEKDGSTTSIIPIETRDYGDGNVTGLTDIYGICLGDQELHGVAPEDKGALIQTYIPDLTQPGVVKKGELEVVASIALEATKACGVFRNIKVQ